MFLSRHLFLHFIPVYFLYFIAMFYMPFFSHLIEFRYLIVVIEKSRRPRSPTKINRRSLLYTRRGRTFSGHFETRIQVTET